MRTPEAWPSTAHTSVAVGTPTSLSVVKSVPTFVLCMSTTGDAPVTVTDSCSDATCSWPSIVRIWPIARMMPGRLNVWNPESSNVSSYGPDGSDAIEYLPSPSVTVVRTPINDGDLAVTVTPGSTAPCASVTLPVSRP